MVYAKSPVKSRPACQTRMMMACVTVKTACVIRTANRSFVMLYHRSVERARYQKHQMDVSLAVASVGMSVVAPPTNVGQTRIVRSLGHRIVKHDAWTVSVDSIAMSAAKTMRIVRQVHAATRVDACHVPARKFLRRCVVKMDAPTTMNALRSVRGFKSLPMARVTRAHAIPTPMPTGFAMPRILIVTVTNLA